VQSGSHGAATGQFCPARSRPVKTVSLRITFDMSEFDGVCIFPDRHASVGYLDRRTMLA